MSTTTKKRMREDDEELDKFRLDCKRSRTLPFRVSPTFKHTRLFSQRTRSIPIPQTITPDSSDSDISPTSPTNRSFTSPRNFSSQITAVSSTAAANGTADGDFDMADLAPTTTTTTSCHPSPNSSAPRALHHASGGRIPTPIYTHFPLPTNDITMSSDIDLDDLDSIAPSPQTQQRDLDCDLLLLRRRLPSPIGESEDESMVSPTSGAGGMLGRLNVRNNAVGTGEEERAASGGMDVETQHHSSHQDAVSKAGWWKRKDTVGGGKVGKTVLVMGYRADCEKCRTRVPGHWSHFIRA